MVLQAEVGAVYEEAARQRERARAHRLVLGVVAHRDGQRRGEICDSHLQRPEYCHQPARAEVELGARDALEHLVAGEHAVGACHSDLLAEPVDRLGREAAPAQPGEREQSRVVPAAHDAPGHERVELALGEHAVRDVEAAVLPRLRLVHAELVEQPVVGAVGRLARLKLERAERVRHVLDWGEGRAERRGAERCGAVRSKRGAKQDGARVEW